MKNMLDIAQAKEQTAKLSSARLAAGQDSILQATQAQELALGAQSDAESARNTALSSWISAQIALGAGWRMEEPQK
jgi:outer membrane protein TolC